MTVAVAVTVGALAIVGGAWAYFTSSGSGTGAASVGTLTAAVISAPSASKSPVTITISTQAAAMPSSADSGITYSVLRKSSGSYAAVTSGPCSGALAYGTTSCADNSVASDGSYSYEAVAHLGGFSAPSNAVSVNVDVTPSTDTVALVSPSHAYLNTSTETIYFNTNTGGSFSLSDAVNDTGSGPASATFPGISATGWTGHTTNDLQTSGTGSKPTITYTSATAYNFSTSGVATTGTVSSKDVVGNTSTGVALTLTPDSVGPIGGALSVNSTVATSGGSSSLTNATSYSISRADFNADTGSGVASSVLTVRYAPWLNHACGTYGPATTITASPTQTESSGDGCYRYTLTGTDNVGNTSTLTTTVEVDTTPPTVSTPIVNGYS